MSSSMRQATGQALDLESITHRYGAAVAVDDVSLGIRGGEFVALLGPSGCGKTTLLRAIAGFLAQSTGSIRIAGQAVDHLPPNRRAVGIVFQSYALFPHMTAAENIAYGLDARGVARQEKKQRVGEMLALVKLEQLAERYPRQLSGGQQQRVALARALAVKPSILLLDEPFAALDKNLRLDMQIEIKRIQRLAGTTTILVTHDQEEALSMADRVAVLNHGRLEQFGTPTEIYDRPNSLFVNTFVGSANVLPGRLLSQDATSARVTLDTGEEIEASAPRERLMPRDRVLACIRPEHLRLAADGPGVAGTVEFGLPLGPTIVHEVRTVDGAGIKVAEPRTMGAEPRLPGTAVKIRPIAPDAISIFPEARA